MVRFIYVLFFILFTYNIDKSNLEVILPITNISINESKVVKTDSLEGLIKAITQVECSGDLKAYNPKEDAVGGLQIRPMMVKDVNRILKIKGKKRRYKLSDRWDYKKSKEMFKIYVKYYCKNKPFEIIAKRWNGGPNGEYKENTTHYWFKVKRELKKI